MLDTKAMAEALLEAVRKWVQPAFEKVGHRLAKAEARIAALEANLANGPFKFMGPYTEGMDYTKGNFVVHQGSLWHCNHDTRDRPGSGYAWTLAAKRGADGKDLRS